MQAAHFLVRSSEQNVNKGYLSTDTIEEVLGGDAYRAYKDAVDTNQSEARQKQLKAQLNQKVYEQTKGDRLRESFFENVRAKQKFTADLNRYEGRARAVMQQVMESGLVDNTNRSHEFWDMMAKLSDKSGTMICVASNEDILKLVKEDHESRGLEFDAGVFEGQTIEGFTDGRRIVLNAKSPRALNFVVGHEIMHNLEKTRHYASLQSLLREYAGDTYDVRFNRRMEQYANKFAHDAEFGNQIDMEVAADLVGEYLFNDTAFITHLTKDRNVFQQMWDEVKYLCKLATAGSEQARQLEQIKQEFERAWRESQKNTSDRGVKYSVGETTDGRYVAVVDDDILSSIDTSVWDKETKNKAKREANEALKKFSDGFIINGVEYIGNKDSRDEYTRSKYSETLARLNPTAYLDKMRATSVLDDVIRVTSDWTKDGKLKHTRKDDYVDFVRGKTLIQSGDRGYQAVVLAGIRSNGEVVFYDVEDIQPEAFKIKNAESSSAVSTNKLSNAMPDDSAIGSIVQNREKVKAQRFHKDSGNPLHMGEQRTNTDGENEKNSGSEVKYSVYSRPKFTGPEWVIVNGKKHREFDDPDYDIDTNKKWMYANEKGMTVFAIYSKHNPEDPTVMYGSHGKTADKDHALLQRILKGEIKNGNVNRRAFDGILNDLESRPWHDDYRKTPAAQGGSAAGDVPLSVRKSGGDRGRNRGNGAGNLRISGGRHRGGRPGGRVTGESGEASQKNSGKKPQYSLSAAEQAVRDTEYTSAVQRGDMDTARRLVDEAAEATGVRKLPGGGIVSYYHPAGKSFRGLETEKTRYGNLGYGYYLTPNGKYAAGTARPVKVYLGAARLATDTDRQITPEQVQTAADRFGVNVSASELKGKGDSRILQTLIDKIVAKTNTPATKLLPAFRQLFPYDGIQTQTETALWDPALLQSADPVVYDEGGEVIPLSQRYDWKNGVAVEDRVNSEKPNSEQKGSGIGIKLKTPGNYGEKAIPYSERGIEIEERIAAYLDSLKQDGDFIERPAGELQKQDLAILTTETGVEHSMLTISGKTYLIRGAEKQTTIPEKMVRMLMEHRGTLDCHSHPFIGDLIPSKSDKELMKKLTWQEESVIIDPTQTVAVYTSEGVKYISDEKPSRTEAYYQDIFGGD